MNLCFVKEEDYKFLYDFKHYIIIVGDRVGLRFVDEEKRLLVLVLSLKDPSSEPFSVGTIGL